MMIKSYTTQLLTIGLIAMMSCKASTTNNEKPTPEMDSDEMASEERTVVEKDKAKKSDFPDVVDVDKVLKSTDFVVSPDKSFPKNKNIVYTPTLIAAWETLVKGTKNQLVMTSNGEDYLLLEKGRKYIAALDPGDYTASYKETGNTIIAEAAFKKSLPFEVPFVKTQGLAFKQKPVQSFGMIETIIGIYKYLKVDYYKSNNDFIISITPADANQEIILVKGDKSSQNFTAVMKRIEDLRKVSANSRNYTKPNISKEPLKIPKIIFNLKKSFQSLVEQSFDYRNEQWGIDSAKQETAFRLDEKGAKVESKAEIVASTRGESEEATNREFIFDTDFYIILKDKRKAYPYFGLKIVDDELLVKE